MICKWLLRVSAHSLAANLSAHGRLLKRIRVCQTAKLVPLLEGKQSIYRYLPCTLDVGGCVSVTHRQTQKIDRHKPVLCAMEDQKWDIWHISYSCLHLIQSVDQCSRPAKPGPAVIDQRVFCILLHLDQGQDSGDNCKCLYWSHWVLRGHYKQVAGLTQLE